jgi:tight adherence protein C
LRLRFLNAGIRHENAPLLYFGIKTLLPLGDALAVYSSCWPSRPDSNERMFYPLGTRWPATCPIWCCAGWPRAANEIFENFPMPPI